MNKFLTVLYKVICLIMLVFFGYVYLGTLGNLSHMPVISAHLSFGNTICFFLFGTLSLFLLFFYFSDERRRKILWIFAALGIVLQFFVIFGIRPSLRYDSLIPLDTAMGLMSGKHLTQSTFYEYLTVYPHNLPLTAYILVILKAAQFLGVPESCYTLLLQSINCILIDLSVFGIYRLLDRHGTKRQSAGFLLLCVFNPLLYYYPVFFYTQVLCIPIICGLTVLFFHILETRCKRARILYSIGYGIVLFFGIKIRILALIVPIACCIYLVLKKRWEIVKKKDFYFCLTGLLSAFLICAFANNLLLDHYSMHTDESLSYPPHHWVMMGLGENGAYNTEDEVFTSNAGTKEERIEADTAVIKERLKNLGFTGLVRLWADKLVITWSDGYDDFADNLVLSPDYRDFHDYLSGSKNELLVGYLHIYHSFCCLLLTICVVLQIFKKSPSVLFIPCLTLLGGMLFHLIWETGEAYSMPFALLVIAGGAGSLEITRFPAFCRNYTKNMKILALLTLCGNLFLITQFKPVLCDLEFQQKKTAAIQDLTEGSFLTLSERDTLTQTFSTSRAFNRVMLQYVYLSSNEEASVLVTLKDERENIFFQETASCHAGYSGIVLCEFSPITPKEKDTFFIELQPQHIPEDAKLAFFSYHTGNWDVYQPGSLFFNGIEEPKSDLTFRAYLETSDTFF